MAEDPERERTTAAAVRSAQLSIILMVAAAVWFTVGMLLHWPAVDVVAGLLGFVGCGLLFLTGLQSGRGDAPRP